MARSERSIVVGTAGHIDHGKTTLVRALTGTDTDRLPEEQRRGITIELGFAPWTIAPGIEASIVDVPGHEAFVRTMIAGAGGVDVLLLVVSAEDGVMPQTREHLHVCELLGVDLAVVALTKCDAIDQDPEVLELLIEDVRTELASTPFAQAPIVPCSAATGQGMDELERAVRKAVGTLARRDPSGAVILPIDRVFTMKGHGTVVTGTLLGGIVDLERTPQLDLIASNKAAPETVRLRGIQVRGQSVPRARAGTRVALNLSGVEVGVLSRGDVLCSGSRVRATRTLLVHARHFEHDPHPWASDTAVSLSAGTANVEAWIDPLNPPLAPGTSGPVRVRTEKPIPAWHGQRVVFRAFNDPGESAGVASHGKTIGGGEILDPRPRTARGWRERWRELAPALAGDPRTRLTALIHDAKTRGLSLADLAQRSGVEDPVPALADVADVRRLGDLFVSTRELDELEHEALRRVEAFHDAHPLQSGLPRAALEGAMGPTVAPALATAVVDGLLGSNRLLAVEDGAAMAIPGRGPGGTLPPEARHTLELYEDAGITPPTLKEVAAHAGVSERRAVDIVALLQRTGHVVRIAPDLSMAGAAHDELVSRVRAHLREHGDIDVQALKSLTGLSRKYAVPFLEHLDHEGVTRRVGDRRVPGPRIS